MSPKAGETGKKTATYYCDGCNRPLQAIRGATLPSCTCGGSCYGEKPRTERVIVRSRGRRGSR